MPDWRPALLAAAFALGPAACGPKVAGQRVYAAAVERVYRGEFRAAVRDLTALLRDDPRNPRAYYLRGMAHLQLKNFGQAVADLGRAADLDPGLQGARYQIGVARLELGDPLGALADLDAALKIRPDAPEILYQRAEALRSLGLSKRAEASLDRALSLKAGFHAALVSRGYIRLRRDDLGAARADFERATRLRPADSQGYVGRARVLRAWGRREDLDLAARDLDTALKLSPGNVELYAVRAGVHLDRYDFDAAVADFSAAIRFNPRNADLHMSRGRVYRDMAVADRDDVRLAAAEGDLSRAIEIAPKLRPAYFFRGNVRDLRGDSKGGLEDRETILRLQPKDPAGFSGLCSYYCDQQRYADAVRNCDRAIELWPRYADPLRLRCRARRLQGRYADGLKDCDAAVEYAPFWDDAYFERGLVHQGRKDYPRALTDLETASRINPRSKAVAEALADLRKRFGPGGKR
ncbi:MAG: tetratricopeptide repeat protein [Elusimicrobia bacterium]|nr:tetratricopeptide repeat protein [Elusimicrobiota bacterium]